MQESIFYNKEQVKIIRYYGWIHRTLFKYWVALFAWIVSIIASFLMITSGYFSSIYLLEKKDNNTVSQAEVNYNNKVQQVASVPGLKWVLLNGYLNISNWNIIGEDVLLEKDGLTLPRKTNISINTLNEFAQWQDKERYIDAYMMKFFQTVLVAPMTSNHEVKKNPPLFSLWGSSLKNLFGLECTTTKSSSSFVCKSYVRNFLDRFYLYDLSNSTNEISLYYNALSTNLTYKKDLCDWLLSYGHYVTSIDSNLTDIFRNCGSYTYNDFVLLRDFLSLNKQFWAWYIESSAYNNRNLNEYKLYSFQQLIYRGISSSADVKSLIQSYIGFLREVLLKEEGKQDELLSTFSKSFAYWFNMNVLSSYFKDEKSKMSKEDRTSLNSDMLTINYGDTIAGFKWLQEKSRYKYETSTPTKSQTTTVTKKQPLKDVFRQSYLPANFNLYSVEDGEDENTIIVNWVDLRTNFTITANLKYENLQLFVTNIEVSTERDSVNETLSNFVNSTINASKTKYSLNQALTLIIDNKDFADKPTDSINLCDQLEDAYHSNLVSCNDTKIEMKWNVAGKDGVESVLYTFTLNKKGVLIGVKVNHELLESQILASLNLSDLNASSTLYMIKRIMSYKLEDNETGYGLKEYRWITEVIEKFLWDKAKVEPDNGTVKVFFSAGWVDFTANYDSVSHELNPISIIVKWRKQPIIVQGLKLTLKEENLKGINDFLNDPISKLNALNPALVERYYPKAVKK